MSNVVEYIDEYGDRYLTTITQTATGKEILTQIYSVNTYQKDRKRRTVRNGKSISIEIFGNVTTTIDILNHNNNPIVSSTSFSDEWIEVWNSCVDSRNRPIFKHRLNTITTTRFVSEMRSGSSFVGTDSSINSVVWGDVDESGEVVNDVTSGAETFEFINVW
jgi:hypothetical protein